MFRKTSDWRSAWLAPTAPRDPGEALITAAGLPLQTFLSMGREPTSTAFFRTPGIEKLYSGEAMSTPSAARMASRKSATAFGKPTQEFLDAEKATLEGMEAGLAAAKPGNACEDIANAFFAVLKKYGIVKDNRTGYSIGLSYPPDWGERTMSLRPGDRTELKPGMTFHFMTGLWLETMGLEITESILITETGVECLANVPRKLVVKN